jgi:hypothetical protein
VSDADKSVCEYIDARIIHAGKITCAGDLPLKNIGQASPEVSGIVEHLFRHEGAKMVAILTRIFGIEHLNLAEDVVQEALVRALQTWPFYGVPKNRPGLCARRVISRWTWFGDERYFRTNRQKSLD